MAKLSLLKGSASQTVNIFIQDSASTTGAGKTGLLFNSAGLTAYYVRPRSAPVAITLATLASNIAAYSSGGFIEIDATNMPGWYRLDVPDAALATGAGAVGIHLKGAAGMAPVPLEIELTAVDNQDGVRFGMTSLPNVVVNTVGGLPVLDANSLVDVDVKRWLAVAPNALQTGRVDSYVGAAAAAVETEFANALLDAVRAGHTAAGTVGQSIDKVMTGITGAALSAAGLDLISTADITSDADARSTFPKMARAVFNRFYNEVRQTATAQTIRNDAAVVTSTKAVSDDGVTQTLGKSA